MHSVWSVPLENGTARKLADLADRPRWSPDGKRLVSASADATVHLWDAITGQTQLIYKGHSEGVFGVAWSPDGRRIASASRDKTVQVWDAATGATVLTYRGHTSPVTDVAWSPDGRRIASSGGDATVQVWDATSGRPRRGSPGPSGP